MMRLLGTINVPGDKSISHRAVMLGAIARDNTHICGLLDCDDCNFTIDAFKKMGVKIAKDGAVTTIAGAGLRGLKKPAGAIMAGESGTTMRILPGILAGQDFEAKVKGAPSLLKRPMKRIIEPLSKMGIDISASKDGFPPLVVRGGKVNPIDYKMPVASAQVKSAILFAGLYGDGVTKVTEIVKSRDHTERMMKYFGADINVKDSSISVKGGKELTGRSFEIPGDISSAAFFMAGAVLIPGSKVTIGRVNINPTRAGVIDVMAKMGANVRLTNKKDDFEPSADIEVSSGEIHGITIEEKSIPAIIDELPIIFVLASLSRGRTIIKGAGELRVKETDRIKSMQDNISNMGGRFEVEGDSIIIEGVDSLNGTRIKAHGDHRTCMAMAIASLAAKGESHIDDVECVNKSFPGFFKTLERLKC